MRIPNPPYPSVSADGQCVAALNRQALTLIRVDAGAAETLSLPFRGISVAFSPSAAQAAVSGSGQIALFNVRPAWALCGQAPTPAPLFRQALGEGGVVVGAAKFGETQTNLCVWRGAQLQPAFSGEGYALGSVAPYALRLNRHNDRVLVAGASGRGAYSGGGRRFAGLVQLGQDRIDVVWKGAGLPVEPDGYLYPLAEDRLGLYQRNELRVVALRTAADEVAVESVARYAFADLETVVASPDGNHVAWIWGTGPGSLTRVRAARLSDGTVVDEGRLENVGYFPAIAVNDVGRVTLVYSEPPDRLFVLTLEQGQFVRRAAVTIPDWEDV